MTKKNNVKCVKKQCGYEWFSHKMKRTNKVPKACPKCKQYDCVSKI